MGDGPGTVHMTGNLLDDPPPDGMLGGDWSEEESEDSDDSVEESVATGDKIKEVSEKEAKKILKRKTEVPKDNKIAGSKANETPKTSKDKKNKPMQEDKTKDPEITNDELKTPKSGDVKTQKAVTKTPKTDVKTPKDDVKTPKQELKTPKQEVKTSKDSQTPGKTPKRTLKGGVQVEDLKEGSGPE